jgi:hypothetical protein
VEEKATPIDPEKVWQSLLAKIPGKSFLRTLSELVRPIGTDGRNFLLGHSPDDKAKVEALATVNNRRQLETILGDVGGRDWSVKFLAKDGMPPSTASESDKSAESFKDDPLIHEAIELFNARVRP